MDGPVATVDSKDFMVSQGATCGHVFNLLHLSVHLVMFIRITNGFIVRVFLCFNVVKILYKVIFKSDCSEGGWTHFRTSSETGPCSWVGNLLGRICSSLMLVIDIQI